MRLFLCAALVLAAARPLAADSLRPIRLSAVLTTPTDVDLAWSDPSPGAAGHTVEWTTDPAKGYTILEFLPPDRSAYRHPDLMPETVCYYRVRAYYGAASNHIAVRLPQGLSDAAYAAAFAKPEDYRWAGPETLPEAKPAVKHSIRLARDDPEAAPAGLAATLMPITVSGFRLSWTNHASDADGVMVEIQPAGESEFRVRAIVHPEINSFGWAFTPPRREATIRVRAYRYGEPSNVVQETTGEESHK